MTNHRPMSDPSCRSGGLRPAPALSSEPGRDREDRPICRTCNGDGQIEAPRDWRYSLRTCPFCDGTGFVERRTEHPEVRSALDKMTVEERGPFVSLLRYLNTKAQA